jgi:hypothetical protein
MPRQRKFLKSISKHIDALPIYLQIKVLRANSLNLLIEDQSFGTEIAQLARVWFTHLVSLQIWFSEISDFVRSKLVNIKTFLFRSNFMLQDLAMDETFSGDELFPKMQ